MVGFPVSAGLRDCAKKFKPANLTADSHSSEGPWLAVDRPPSGQTQGDQTRSANGLGEAEMAQGWIRGAIVAWGLAAVPAAAQMAALPGGASMPEPLPVAQASPACLAGAGMGAPACGQGGDSCLALPSDLPNAWSKPEPCSPPACYMSIGYTALQRQRLGHRPVAILDPGSVDTGDFPPLGSPAALDFEDLNPRFNHGIQAMIGYHWDSKAIEVGGFYLSQNSSSKQIEAPGRLDLPFIGTPVGFEGDNGMFLQDDVVKLRLQTALGSGEVNFRCWVGHDTGFSCSLGVRYLDVYERFGIYAGDDDLTVLDAAGNPDPTRQATYSVTTHNRLVAPQLGVEWNRLLCDCWGLTFQAKGAWGVNFLDVDTALKRGDAFPGPSGHRSDEIFSHLYEAGFYLDYQVCERARLRAGYHLLWVVDVAEAVDQVDFHLANTTGGNVDNHGSIFYHGPVVELHFLF